MQRIPVISKASQGIINHVALVIDASSSMYGHRDTVVKVVDAQIAHLAQRSKEMDQETRITVYVFSDHGSTRCLIYDKDVLRMPSIAQLYTPNGMTALLEATIVMLDDLAMTPEKYGEHAFLAFVITDGQENHSRGISIQSFKNRLETLPDNWTLGLFVPDAMGIHEAKRAGFPANNISVWNTSTSRGVEEVGQVIKQATDTFMTNRAKGIKSTKSLFTQTVDVNDIKTKLTPVTQGSYQLLDVPNDSRADEFMAAHAGGKFVIGAVFYELVKSEKVQANKDIAILHGDDLYMGRGARDMIGLPSHDTRIRPGDHKDYKIFVQSTAPNRKLLGGTQCVITR